MAKLSQIEHPVYSRNVVEFVTVAVEYCNYIEQCKNTSAKDFSEAILRLLPLTYLKASMITAVESKEENQNEDFINEEIYVYILELVSQKLGENDLDCNIPETASQNNEMTTAPISEILADVYQDLKNFVMSYRTGEVTIMNDAIFVCKLNFEQFWGARLLAAQPAIHKLVFENTVWESTPKNKKIENDDTDTSQWIISQRQQEWGYGI
jgi:hypothetical protein